MNVFPEDMHLQNKELPDLRTCTSMKVLPEDMHVHESVSLGHAPHP